MVFQINFKSGKPPYLQIVDQVRHAAAAGLLRPGEALPPIRELAQRLAVNRNTVAKAYTELERAGIVETRAGKGCYLKENTTPLRKVIRLELLAEALDEAIVRAHHFQISDDELRELLDKRLEAFARRRAEAGGST